MKKLVFLIFIILMLSACQNKNIEIEYEYDNASLVYAYNIENKSIEKVYIDYEINDYIDVFNIYTIYQNYLPNHYGSMASANVKLLNSYVEDEIVYYDVDSYIYLSKDIEIFLNLLRAMNKQLGYKDTILIHNYEQVT